MILSAAATLLVSLAAVIITIVVMLPEKTAAPRGASSGSASVEAYLRPEFADFQIPEEYKLKQKSDWHRSREINTEWSWEQVEEFWISPAEIAADIYKKQNEKIIDDYFRDIP